nr:reverse transcriptase domain-containing protein [Tanacetum cinerariifolium]
MKRTLRRILLTIMSMEEIMRMMNHLNDDDDDDDVEKDKEDKEEEEHLASADPSDVSTDDLETMTTVNQGMSVEEIERVVAQRVANAIEAIAIYETKTNLARKSMSQTERQKEEVVENDSNKRKWESNHIGSLSQQNKGHKVPRAHTAWPINKKAYDGSLPLCNQCKLHHSGPCTVKCGNYKKVGHIIQNCKTLATAKNQRTRTCYEYGSLRHYKSECLIVKFHKHVDMIHGRVRASKPKTMQDAIETTTKLMNKKISTLVECQTENKKRLDNTFKNNQNQQQPNKRQNTGRAYNARHGEKKHYGGSKPLCSKCNYHHNGPCAPKCHKCNRVLNARLRTRRGWITLLRTIRTKDSQTRDKTLAVLTLQGMGRRNITVELSHCVLNATITMMVHVLPNATSATERLHATNVEIKGTTGEIVVGNKMHKAFLLPGENSHWQYKFPLPVEGVPTARRMEIPLPGVCTAMMKKLPVKDRWQLH